MLLVGQTERALLAAREPDPPQNVLESNMKLWPQLWTLSVLMLSFSAAHGQETAPADAPAASASDSTSLPETSPSAPVISTEAAQDQVGKIAEQVNQSEQAQEVSAGILKQIYVLAEKMESDSFHWIAFALMVTGVVSFTLQLVLGKLFVLARMSISISEILSDAVGLAISLVGLVLTTQAAAQNSTFTTSPAAVLSSTAAGAVLGFLFFRWGTKQELSAAAGRKGESRPAPAAAKPRL